MSTNSAAIPTQYRANIFLSAALACLAVGCASAPTTSGSGVAQEQWECQQIAKVGLDPEPTAQSLAKLTPQEYDAYRKRSEEQRRIYLSRLEECLKKRSGAR